MDLEGLICVGNSRTDCPRERVRGRVESSLEFRNGRMPLNRGWDGCRAFG